jgi:hypothetical protein
VKGQPPKMHPETREALFLVGFIVACFLSALIFLVVIIVFFMKYD